MTNGSPQPTHALHAIVEGRVQGVGFREACVDEARALALAGWVRNRHDGTVEVLVQGPPDAVASMRAWLQHGPRWAQVQRVIATPREPDTGAPLPFVRKATG